MNHEAVVHAQAGPEDVWSFLVDVEGWPSWTPSVRRAQLLTPAPLAVGSRVRLHQPRLAPMTWTVTKLDAPVRFTWAAKAPGLHIVADHILSPASDGTTTIRLTIEETGGLARAIEPLTRGTTDRYVRIEAQSLKESAERVAARRGDASESHNQLAPHERTT